MKLTAKQQNKKIWLAYVAPVRLAYMADNFVNS